MTARMREYAPTVTNAGAVTTVIDVARAEIAWFSAPSAMTLAYCAVIAIPTNVTYADIPFATPTLWT